ncbi:MAG: hypothetical protein JF614_21420 [Acidobacteria bacterium]|nr:hypothetical protein [Acidobacteriota bacterium]
MRRSVIALALAASTLTATPSSLVPPLWSLLSALWGEEGAGVDPSGQNLAAQGPGMDPNGRSLTAPQPTPDEGPGADPNG